jgi:Ankyrin repeats (3 copies)
MAGCLSGWVISLPFESNFLMYEYFEQQNGNSPLHIAAENGNEAIVDGLLEKDADINEVDMVSGTELSVVIIGCFPPFLCSTYPHTEHVIRTVQDLRALLLFLFLFLFLILCE